MEREIGRKAAEMLDGLLVPHWRQVFSEQLGLPTPAATQPDSNPLPAVDGIDAVPPKWREFLLRNIVEHCRQAFVMGCREGDGNKESHAVRVQRKLAHTEAKKQLEERIIAEYARHAGLTQTARVDAVRAALGCGRSTVYRALRGDWKQL